jgi:hypothetical protein
MMTICQIGVVLRKKMTEDATKETMKIEAVTVVITLAKVEAIHKEDKVRAIRILMAIMVTIIKMVVAKATTKTQHPQLTATQAMAGVVARL